MLVAIGYFIQVLGKVNFLRLFGVSGKLLLVAEDSLIGHFWTLLNNPLDVNFNLLITSASQRALVPLFQLFLFLNLLLYKTVFMYFCDCTTLSANLRTFSSR